MFGALTLPTGTSLSLPPENRSSLAGTLRSDRKMSFAARTPCKAAMQSFADIAPLVAARKPSSLYDILRIKHDASPVEIKTAYRTLAKLYHPDASASESDGRDFIAIHNAYATLSDPAARALYDLSLGIEGRRRSFGYAVGSRPGFYPTRRWETDQCW